MVNQRQLNGGEQGEGSGLDADKLDSKEVSDIDVTNFTGFPLGSSNISLASTDLSDSDSIDADTVDGKNDGEMDAKTVQGNNPGDLLGMSTNERQAFNDLIGQMARNDFEDNLSALNYDGGFYEIFKDESKIASKTNVSISTLESGDEQGKVTLSQSLGGSEKTGGNSYDVREDPYIVEIDINARAIISQVNVRGVDYSDKIFTVKDESGNILAEKTVYSEPEPDVRFSENDYDRIPEYETVTLEVDGNGDTMDLVDNFSDSGDLFEINNGKVPADEFADIDTFIEFTEVSYESSGSITLVSKDLSLEENGGFTSAPTSAVLSQSASIDSAEDIQYVLRDGNGNTATLTQSDVDTEVDTSNFTSTSVEVEIQLSQTGGTAPTSDDVMVHFKE